MVSALSDTPILCIPQILQGYGASAWDGRGSFIRTLRNCSGGRGSGKDSVHRHTPIAIEVRYCDFAKTELNLCQYQGDKVSVFEFSQWHGKLNMVINLNIVVSVLTRFAIYVHKLNRWPHRSHSHGCVTVIRMSFSLMTIFSHLT